MALRTVCVCDGEYIGIETIFTIIDGKQINIPDKLKYLRQKSRENSLFCPCGCGANLILVASDKSLRKQHFRIKDDFINQKCNAVKEGKVSINSKIVLKCWLDEKLNINNLESRVQIRSIDDSNRKYEFTFLSREKKIALCYATDSNYSSDEKLEELEANSYGISIIHVVSSENVHCTGQYPENLMRIQDIQGYVLALTIEGTDYSKAILEAMFFSKDIDGFWRKVSVAKGHLREFSFNNNRYLLFNNVLLKDIQKESKIIHDKKIEADKKKREYKLKQIENKEASRRKIYQHNNRNTQKIIEPYNFKENSYQNEEQKLDKKQIEEEKQRDAITRQNDFELNIKNNFIQQDTQVIDGDNNRWIKCKECGKIDKVDKFITYGGEKRLNLGICRICFYSDNEDLTNESNNNTISISKNQDNKCPKCSGLLKERNGKFGKFLGCSNYPRCEYTRNI